MRQKKKDEAGEKNVPDVEMRPEYDFTRAVRGNYCDRYRSSSNIVVLDPDVAAAFPNAASVNDALRMLVTVARKRVAKRRSAIGRQRLANQTRRTRSAKVRRRGPRK
jgi:hypothetical protein